MNSWLNYHDKGGATYPHCHGMAVLSVTTYLNLPPGGGFIEFKDPHHNLQSLHRRSKPLSEWCEVPTSTGDVLLFPGWLMHRTQASHADERRWVLTVNYMAANARVATP